MSDPSYDPIAQLERLKRRRAKRRQLQRRRRLVALSSLLGVCVTATLAFTLTAAKAERPTAVRSVANEQLRAKSGKISRSHSRTHASTRQPATRFHLQPRSQSAATTASAQAIAARHRSPTRRRLAAAARIAAPAESASCPIPDWLRPTFEQASARSGVRLSLLTAVATVESGFDPGARSQVGASGIMQLMPATAAAFDADPSDPSANVSAGARYLASLLTHFGSTELALAAYNAGPSAVEAAGGAPSLETLRYVLNVRALDQRYSGCS